MSNQTDLQKAYLWCDQLAHDRAKNFYSAFRFLSRDRRLSLSTFYAFCSLSDDIADNDIDQSGLPKEKRLELWRDKLDACYVGQPDQPVFISLQDTISKFKLPRKPLDDLLLGIEMDLSTQRYDTFDDLIVYCRRVASSVGLISVRIFGCDNDGADQYADNLGIAFQLTNILRDIGEDLNRNRIYLPLEDLDRFGYSENDLKHATHNQSFLELMEFQYNRATGFYDKAAPELSGKTAKRLLTAEIMKTIYKTLLEEIKHQQFHVFNNRISPPKRRIIPKILTTLVRSLIH